MVKPIQTGGRGTKAKFYKQPRESGEQYQKAARTAAATKHFRNFNRTRQHGVMNTYDDIHFLTVFSLHPNNVLAGDAKTALDAYLDVIWELGATSGNMKELGTTGEPAFKVWIGNWLLLAWELAAQQMLRPFLEGVTESSITDTSTTALAIFNQADWDAFVASCERIDCPDFVINFIKLFCWYIRMTDTYDKAGVTIPPSYFLPIEHQYQLSGVQAYRNTIKGQLSEATLHCKKFGIPFSKFSIDKLKPREVGKGEMWKDQDIVSFFGHVPYNYKGSGAAAQTFPTQSYTGANLVADYTNAKFPQINGSPPSIFDAIIGQMWGTYHATNNPYGGLFYNSAPVAAEYNLGMRHMKLLGTSWTAATMSSLSSLSMLKMFCAFWRGESAQGFIWSGTNVTADQLTGIEQWTACDANPNIMWGNAGVGALEQIDAIQAAGKHLMFGGE
jgi:hypothetical protein